MKNQLIIKNIKEIEQPEKNKNLLKFISKRYFNLNYCYLKINKKQLKNLEAILNLHSKNKFQDKQKINK